MNTLIFENVTILDPEANKPAPGRLVVKDGLIAGHLPPGAEGMPEDAVRIDGGGAALCPGLIDLRASTGEPGAEYRETFTASLDAAAAGGVTTMALLPNTRPAIDEPALVRLLKARGDEDSRVTILPYGALTHGCLGQDMAELGLLSEAGAIAFTDGPHAIADTKHMRQYLAYARGIDALVMQHPEDPSLARGGCATASERATRLGLPQIPPAAEAILMARDIRLAEMTGARLHFAHVSTAEGLELIRGARKRGLPITCDAAPPYFYLDEREIEGFRTYAKLSPPLRETSDRDAVRAALADGTIDAIASDHTPCDADDKRLPFAQARAGGTGLVTLLPITLSEVAAGRLDLLQAVRLLTSSPARLLGVAGGTFRKGRPADLCLFDPEARWTIRAGAMAGGAQNTPFDGHVVTGKVIGTWKNGRRTFGEA